MKTGLKQPYKQFFGTLASQYRIDVIEALSNKPKNVTQICKSTKFNQSTVSHNLKRLEHCGFVFVRRNGKERVYGLNKTTIKPLLKMMHRHMKNYCCKLVWPNSR